MPRMYDIALDEERDVTQADVDSMIDVVHIMSRYRAACRVLEQMCHDACTGELPKKDYYRILGSIENAYTSASAQQAQDDQTAGRVQREQREWQELRERQGREQLNG